MAEKQITINAPAEKVFTYLADFPRHSEWAQHPLKIEQTSPGPAGQGTTYKSVGHQMGRDSEDAVTVTEFVPNQKIVYEAEGREGRFRHWIQLQPGDGGVQVTKGFGVVKANFPFSLMMPIVTTFVAPGGLNGDLKRIKEKIEGS
jgi:uncharacterized protein YndB with AHSA1/START domain